MIKPITILSCLLIFVSSTTHAATYLLLQNDALIGHSHGLDGLWGTADDQFDGLLNPLGGASGFGDTNSNYGFVVGSWNVNGDDRPVFGVNPLTMMSIIGETSNFPSIFNSPFNQELNPAVSATTTINPNQTIQSTYGLTQSDDFGGHTLSATGEFRYMLPGQDPAVVFAGDPDVITHVNMMITLLPVDWTLFATGFLTYAFTSGVNDGAFGTLSTTYYSIDSNAAAIPIPAALWLFSSGLIWLAGGALLHRRQ